MTSTIKTRKFFLVALILFGLVAFSQFFAATEASAASGWQTVSDTSGPWTPNPPSGMGNSFEVHARVEGPVTVSPGEDFTVELYAFCTGDDWSPQPIVGASLQPDGTSPTYEDFCPGAGFGTLVETRTISAPMVEGPVNLELFPYLNCGGGCITSVANDPAIYTYTVVAPCANEWEITATDESCSDQWVGMPPPNNCTTAPPGSFDCPSDGSPVIEGGACNSAGFQCFKRQTSNNHSFDTWRCTFSCGGGGPIPPAISVTPLGLDFGDVEIGDDWFISFEVRNTGGGTIDIPAMPDSTAMTGAFASVYECSSISCDSAQTLTAAGTPGDRVTYTVRYAPDVVSDGQNAVLELGGTIPTDVMLTGNGISNWCWDREMYSELVGDDPWQFCEPPGFGDDCNLLPRCQADLGYDPNGPADGTPYMGGPTRCVGVAPNGNSGSTAGNWAFCPGGVIPDPTARFTDPATVLGGPDVVVPIAYDTPVTLEWTSTDATDCQIRDITNNITWSGEPTTGQITSGSLIADADFTVSCRRAGQWSADSPNALVRVAPPVAPSVDISAAPNTVDYGQTTNITWEAINADSCNATAGPGFDTGGGVGLDSDESDPLTTFPITTFSIRCFGQGGTETPASVDVTVLDPEPNLTVTITGYDPSAGIDAVNGTYDFVTMNNITVTNNGDADAGAFQVRVTIDHDQNGIPEAEETYLIGGLGVGATDQNNSVAFFNVPFLPLPGPIYPEVTAEVDYLNAVGESDETDNVDTEIISDPLPDIGMELTIDPSDLVRGGSDITLDWNTVAEFPMNCTLSGPSIYEVTAPGSLVGQSGTISFDPDVDGPTGSATAGPINSKSQYTLLCTEPLTGTDFTASAVVETTGTVEEI